jgi:excinuclease ABC subunit C
MPFSLKDKIALLPRKAGVYKFFDNRKEILYIGKATNLSSRVASYFSDTHADRPRIISMIPLIEEIETIETENELEALVLESALIKKYKPKYNQDQKDDKSYAWIYVDTQNKFPTVEVVRNVNRSQYKKGRLFGPYPNSRATKRIFNYLRKMYPFCTNKNPKKNELCFYYHLGLCPGPHQGKISEVAYRKNVNNIVRFLTGRKKGEIENLETQMRTYAKNQNFEKAAELRDKVDDLKHLGAEIGFTYFTPEAEYLESRDELLKEELNDLKSELGIKDLGRIECYDISNLKGKMAFGSMVVSLLGKPQKAHYRVFKIKGKDTPNDPGMLKEVLVRRLKHIEKDTDPSLVSKPSLVLIDGGKSQLSVLKSVIPQDIPLLGISKGKRLKRKKQTQIDEFWIRKGNEILQIEVQNVNILVRLRDESHRFALLHHRKLRKFVQKKSALDDIEGVGPKRRRALINKFESVDGIRKVTVDEIDEVIRNRKLSERIATTLKV